MGAQLPERHSLIDTPFEELVAWPVGDFRFHHEADHITSTIKIRQAGFADALDTETRLLDLFERLIAGKGLPPVHYLIHQPDSRSPTPRHAALESPAGAGRLPGGAE